jgi:hypothetical protein
MPTVFVRVLVCLASGLVPMARAREEIRLQPPWQEPTSRPDRPVATPVADPAGGSP